MERRRVSSEAFLVLNSILAGSYDLLSRYLHAYWYVLAQEGLEALDEWPCWAELRLFCGQDLQFVFRGPKRANTRKQGTIYVVEVLYFTGYNVFFLFHCLYVVFSGV